MAIDLRRSGWVTFAGVLAAIVAVYNILSGIGAITQDDMIKNANEVLYGIDLTAWGWFWLVLGVVQLVVAWLILARHPLGQMLGLIWAFIVAALSVFVIFVAPLWSLIVLGMSILVIWALTSHPEEFDET